MTNMTSPRALMALAGPASAAENPQSPAEIADAIGKRFEEFKAANDERFASIEKGLGEDPIVREKVEKLNAEIGDLQAMLDETTKAVGRLTAGGGSGGDGKDVEASDARRFYALVNDGEAVANPDLDEYRAYSRAINTYIRRGDLAIKPDVRAALSVGADPEGGFWIQPDRTDQIVTRMFETSPMREVANIETIGTDTFEYPLDTNDATSGGWVAEKGARTETATPDVGVGKIFAHEQYAEPRATQKILDDMQFDIEGWLIRKISDKLVRTENAAFVTGNGSSKPRGFVDYGSSAVTTDDGSRDWGVLQYVPVGAAGAFPTISGGGADGASDPDALVTIIHKLKPSYRTNARWMMNRATVGEVRKLKDANGQYLWSMGNIQAGQPQQLLGYPITEAEDMADMTSDSISIAFGDFRSGYTIVDRLGLRLLRDPYTTKGFVKFYVTKRVGGDVVDFDAIKLLKFASS